MVYQSSYANTPAHNGVSKRKNRHPLEVVRSLLIRRNVTKCYWGDAVLTKSTDFKQEPFSSKVPSKVTDLRNYCLEGLLLVQELVKVVIRIMSIIIRKFYLPIN